MELKSIEAFLLIAEKGSFTKAAESLFITQPTLSLRIQRLEQELDIVLFQRNGGKKASLTQAGEDIYHYFDQGFRIIQEGLDRRKKPIQKYTIGCPNHMGQRLLSAVLKKLDEQFPNVEFVININVSLEILANLRNGKNDIGFVYLDNIKSDQNLSLIPITNEETILVVASNHLLAKKDSVILEDLKSERIIVYEREFITTIKVDRFLKSNGIEDCRILEVKNIEWLKNMVVNGMGIAFLHKNIVENDLMNGNLAKLILNKDLPTTPISLIYRKSIPHQIKMTLIETAKRVFE